MSKALIEKITQGSWISATGGTVMRDQYHQPFCIAQKGFPNLIGGCFVDVRGGEETAQANADFIGVSPDAIRSFIKALRMIDMQALSVPEGIIKIVHEASGETIVEKNIGGVQETLNEFQLAMAEASAFAEYITGEKL